MLQNITDNTVLESLRAIAKQKSTQVIVPGVNYIPVMGLPNAIFGQVFVCGSIMTCKSCGFCLDIKKYIQDGVFDEEKGFITFSMPMETNLEDIPEYEKFNFSIKIII